MQFKIIDFIKSPPGMVLCLVLAVLSAFWIFGEERERSRQLAEKEADTSGLDSDPDHGELAKPVIVDRRSSYQPFSPTPPTPPAPAKKVAIAEEQSDELVVSPDPEPPEIFPVLVHSAALERSDKLSKVQTPKSKALLPKRTLPFGSLIPCRLIHDVVAGQGKSPLIAVVTQDVLSGGNVVVEEGSLVHGKAATVFRNRLQADPSWRISVGGQERTVQAVLLNQSNEDGSFGFGSAGIEGKRLDRLHKNTGRIFLATAISEAARSFKQTSSGIFGEVPSYSPSNAGIDGASAVADRHAEFLLEETKKNERLLEVMAGSAFYLYTLEEVEL